MANFSNPENALPRHHQRQPNTFFSTIPNAMADLSITQHIVRVPDTPTQPPPPQRRRLLVALAGDFGGSYTHAALRAWMDVRRIPHTADLAQATHVVVTLRAWREMRRASPAGRVFVTIEWLEDALLDGRLLDGSARGGRVYIAALALVKKREARRARRRTLRRWMDQARRLFRQGARDAKEDLGSGGWHVYRDATGFRYCVQLVRVDREHATFEEYSLRIYETDAAPHLYAMVVRHVNHMGPERMVEGVVRASNFAEVSGDPRVYMGTRRVLTARPTSFNEAYSKFSAFFALQTGVFWDQRAWGDTFEKIFLNAKGKPVESMRIAAEELGVVGPGGEGIPKQSEEEGWNISLPNYETAAHTVKSQKASQLGWGQLDQTSLDVRTLLLERINPLYPREPLVVEDVVRQRVVEEQPPQGPYPGYRAAGQHQQRQVVFDNISKDRPRIKLPDLLTAAKYCFAYRVPNPSLEPMGLVQHYPRVLKNKGREPVWPEQAANADLESWLIDCRLRIGASMQKKAIVVEEPWLGEPEPKGRKNRSKKIKALTAAEMKEKEHKAAERLGRQAAARERIKVPKATWRAAEREAQEGGQDTVEAQQERYEAAFHRNANKRRNF